MLSSMNTPAKYRAGLPPQTAKALMRQPSAATPSTDPVLTGTSDWEPLMEAIQATLRSHAEAQSLIALPETLQQLRQQMANCATALAQLQRQVRNERSQHQAALCAAQLALYQAQADLVGTQAGERQARHQALHDTLTGLPNRRYFRQRLELALSQDPGPPPTGLAVLFIDLDGFKAINDNHGHQIGDELLRVVASRLSRVMRQEDMVSRIGGDEFACLRVGWQSRGQLIQLALKLCEVVAAPLTLGSLKLGIKASIGISLCPADGRTVPDLLKAADLAMYHAKQHLSGHAFHDQCSAR